VADELSLLLCDQPYQVRCLLAPHPPPCHRSAHRLGRVPAWCWRPDKPLLLTETAVDRKTPKLTRSATASQKYAGAKNFLTTAETLT
jgi:hypothetical protein